MPRTKMSPEEKSLRRAAALKRFRDKNPNYEKELSDRISEYEQKKETIKLKPGELL